MEHPSYAQVRSILGNDFLRYVLALDQTVSLEAPSDALDEGRHRVLAALEQLLFVAGQGATNDAGLAFGLSVTVDRYVPEMGSSLANLLRVQAGGPIARPPTAEDPVLNALLSLLPDVYPALLLPRRFVGDMPALSSVAFAHPSRSDLERAVLADPDLSRLYTTESTMSGWAGSAYCSTGRGGSLQLWSFGAQQIAVAHAWASLDIDVPTVDDVADMLDHCLTVVRCALRGEDATVPMRVGIAGVRMPDEASQLDLGWAQLHRPTAGDTNLARLAGIGGQLQTTLSDGSTVTIDYAGDVVVRIDVPYKVVLGEIGLDEPWPPELLTVQNAAATDVESVRLALALAVNDEPPALVVPTWQATVDPLAPSPLVGWNDARQTPNLVPRQLTSRQADVWALWARRVRTHRTPSTAVAVRRMLQALAERRNPEDVLVDAVIVWENLFGAAQETTLRVCTALAWLLSSSASERAASQKRFKELYSLRSRLVHGAANVPADKVGVAARESVQISLSALRAMLEDRPDLLSLKSSEERGNALLLDLPGNRPDEEAPPTHDEPGPAS